MKFEILTEEEFTQFEQNHVLGSFYQTINWGKLKQYNGWDYILVGIKENNEIKAASLLLKKKFLFLSIFYAPRGFLIDYSDKNLLSFFTNNIKKLARKNNAIFVKIDPLIIYKRLDSNANLINDTNDVNGVLNNLNILGYKHKGFIVSGNLQPRIVFTLDLKNRKIEDIYNNFEVTTKQCISTNAKNGVKTRILNKDELPLFKDIMQKTADRRGFIDRSLDYYEKMYETFSNDMQILIAYIDLDEYIDKIKYDREQEYKKRQREEEMLKQKFANVKKINNKIKEIDIIINSLNKKLDKYNEIIKENGSILYLGALMFIFHGKEVLSLFGGAYLEYRDLKPAYTLNYDMIKYACEHGYDRYNFYGISEYKDKDDKMYGLYDFKRGFNGEIEEYIGEFDLITSRLGYFIYNNLFSIIRKIKRVLNR